MVSTYQVDKFWEVSVLISNLASALKHEQPEKVYTDITVKPKWKESTDSNEMVTNGIVGYEIVAICLELDKI